MKPTDKTRTSDPQNRIPVAVAAAHIYLTPAAIESLFCDKYRLHEHSRLRQPTQYAAKEAVTLIGPGGRISNVRVIGPPRPSNQVEISRVDGIALGIDAPIRASGDLQGTPGVIVEGPRARVNLDCGVIRAMRHLHLRPADAERLHLKDQDRVAVCNSDPEPQVLLRDVLVHVSADCQPELHLNSDDGNAAALHSGDYVLLSMTDGSI